jgi:Bifunctional DNA primase/polymerase, N-terminal
MATQEERLRRVVVGFEHQGERGQQAGRDPDDAHSLSQLQVAALLAVGHNVAVVSSHGLRNKLCTCGNEDCERPAAHPGTPHGLADATTDPAMIGVFWTQRPKAKVIIATGPEGIIAVTVRGSKGKRALKAIVGGEDGAALETLQFFDRGVRTYVWRMAADLVPEGEVELADGVIAHGRGSFVVVPRDLRKSTRHKPLYHRDVLPAPSKLLIAFGVPASALPALPLEPESEQDEPVEQDLDLSAYPPSYSCDGSSPETLKLNLFPIDFDWVVTPGGIECDENEVRALAESYEITGPRTPLVVRLLAPLRIVEGRRIPPKFRLVSDLPYFEALKRLGITCADCWVIKGDERDERLYRLAERIHQPDVKWLDWALMVMEWIRDSREKGARVAHPRGGRQPHDKGFAAAHRVLGISRRDLGRAERFANICRDAQAVIRQAMLDDLQVALEEIADEPPQRQVDKALELKERYRKPRRDRATDAATNANTGAQTDQVPEPEAPSLAPNEDDSDQAEDDAAESPATAPVETSGDIDQPSAVQGGAGHYEKYEIIKARWDEYFARNWDLYLEDDWRHAPVKDQLRFIKEVFGLSVRIAGKNHSHH